MDSYVSILEERDIKLKYTFKTLGGKWASHWWIRRDSAVFKYTHEPQFPSEAGKHICSYLLLNGIPENTGAATSQKQNTLTAKEGQSLPSPNAPKEMNIFYYI